MSTDTRYFLGLREDQQFIKDSEGMSFASQAEAQAYALQSMRDIISEFLRTGETAAVRSIEIADEYGVIVGTVTQADALKGIVDL